MPIPPPASAHASESAHAEALAEADLRVLLMCLFHLTGDRRWLEPPFRPVRDVRLVADERAGLPDAVRDEIRAAACALLAGGVPEPAVTDPGDALLQQMMSVCLGEAVPPEYAPMMREEMGFAARGPEWCEALDATDRCAAPHGRPRVLIVGAGVSGIAMAAQLERLGFAYTIVEKNRAVAGTWRENRNPGCGVDTPSHAYSYSFAPHRWPSYFSKRDDVHVYLERCATELGVRAHVRFGTELTGARWDAGRCLWVATLRTAEGEEAHEAEVLVSAIGQVNRPAIPALPGLDDFAGPLFHSARWPDALALEDARVAVIGTGASAMQIVPSIAGRVASLFTLFWRYGDGLLPFLRKDPSWPHPERSLNRGNERHRRELEAFIERELEGRPDLLARCMPSYPPYGKRMLIDNGWFRALRRPNVELVTEKIECLEPSGIVTADGRARDHDVVVLATGFHVTDMAARLGIRGRDGMDLAEAWADGNPTAYLGITVPRFPNFFCLYGPNTNLGHGGSLIFHAECQARYIAACLIEMTEREIAALECKPEACADWVARVDAAHLRMIWTHPGMSTWYRNASGRVISTSPFRLVDYWSMTRAPDLDDFAITPRAASR
jgi:4-hydroxyacetophenone monooxygenase